MKKAVQYLRISTADQEDGFTLEVQNRQCLDLAKSNDLEIVASFVEIESGYTTGKRPQFKQMCELLASSEDVRTIICHMTDRMYRNMSDYAYLMEGLGVTILSVTEGVISDTENQLAGGVYALAARHYSKQLSIRASQGMQAKAANGLYPTYAPMGYINRDKRIEVDPIVAPLLQELFQRYARSDDSLRDLATWAHSRGLRSRYGNRLSKGALHQVLQNPVYVGQIRWKGNLFDGSHEPIVPASLFSAVQDKLHRRNLPRPSKRHFPYRGFVTCGYCGCALTAEVKKGKYTYYHCTESRGKCRQLWYSQEKLSKRLLGVLEGIRLTQENAVELMDIVTSESEQVERQRIARRSELQAEKDRIVERMDRMYEDRLDGAITEEQWKRRDAEHRNRLRMVSETLEETEDCLSFDRTAVETVIELAKRLPDLYLRKSHEERAEALRIVSSNCVLTAESVDPNYKEPFAAIAKWRRSPAWLPG